MSSGGTQLSFKFTKSKEKRPIATTSESLSKQFSKNEDQTDDTERITLLDHDAKQRENKSKAEKDPLVIPMITKNRWNLLDKIAGANADPSESVKNGAQAKQEEKLDVKNELKDETMDESDVLEKAARQAILQEAEDFGKATTSDDLKTIPILFTNQVPGGYETDDKLNVALRPDESEEADYDQVPIEEYGLAMLRGMGWKDGDPIGLSNKQAVSQKIPELRPKGLGLGADKSLVQQLKNVRTGKATSNENSGKEDEKMLKMDSAVRIITGPHRESYGRITGFDEDNARVMVKLALGSSIVSVGMVGVTLVSDKEMDREGKCINKSKYDKFKLEQDKKNMHVMDVNPLHVEESWTSKRPKEKKRKRQKSRSQTPPPAKSKKQESKPWMRADLRVRIIDKTFKGGKYFNAKVRIEDVVSANECNCRTDDNRLLEGISEDMLETVIPRKEPLLVMLVRGKQTGEVGNIVEKDKRSCIASVQLLRQKEKIIRADFDDICEFCGDASAYEHNW